MSYNLEQLREELAAAGVAVPALGCTDGLVHGYDAAGAAMPLPDAAIPVLDAHRPDPTPRERDLALLRASEHEDIQALLRVLGLR